MLHKFFKALVVIAVAASVSACATAKLPSAPISDPFETVNRKVFTFNRKVDEYALKPIASGYRKITPRLVRVGANNFFSNLGDVTVAANGFLQGKLQQGSDAAVFRTTITQKHFRVVWRHPDRAIEHT